LRKDNACEGIRTHESKNSLDLKSSAVLAKSNLYDDFSTTWLHMLGFFNNKKYDLKKSLGIISDYLQLLRDEFSQFPSIHGVRMTFSLKE